MFDYIIRNGRVVDGTGLPWFKADVGITGDRITAVGALAKAFTATSHSWPTPFTSKACGRA
jgi:N-acyl-D-aspartate/D-glutamate deacylase